jgi:hypothetical protein
MISASTRFFAHPSDTSPTRSGPFFSDIATPQNLPGKAQKTMVKVTRKVDIQPCQWDKQLVKDIRKVVERKTPGALMLEKYRPQMNKLTPAQRRQLRDRTMRIAFGHEVVSHP